MVIKWNHGKYQSEKVFFESIHSIFSRKTLILSAIPRSLFPIQLEIVFFTAIELPEMVTDFLAAVSSKILRSGVWKLADPYVEVSYNAIQVARGRRNGTSSI